MSSIPQCKRYTGHVALVANTGPAILVPFHLVNTLRPRQNGRDFADDTFKLIFLNENVGISIKISLKFVPKGPINNIPALVQVMAWCWLGDKPLTEPMVVRVLTHICVTRPQWVTASHFKIGTRRFHQLVQNLEKTYCDLTGMRRYQDCTWANSHQATCLIWQRVCSKFTHIIPKKVSLNKIS